MIDGLADRLGVARPKGSVSPRLARALATAVEAFYTLLRPGQEPPVTRYAVELLCTDMTLDISRARRELGYAPEISMAEGLSRTFAQLENPAA